jgi:acetylornithine/succinyldiaminopimelate/putrescine aminotransferase
MLEKEETTMTSEEIKKLDAQIRHAHLRPLSRGASTTGRAPRSTTPEGRKYIDFTSGIGVS